MSPRKTNSAKANILFLHHSTGNHIVKGGELTDIRSKLLYKFKGQGKVHSWFRKYNRKNKTNYNFKNKVFPKREIYGWNNYPYDYYNIWVKNSGLELYKGEPTLEILTKQYDLIIFKHCFPVSKIVNDTTADINSSAKTLANYKLQYDALKKKFYQFENTKFLVWTGAALVENATNEEEALYAKEFFEWVKNTWDESGDNIYIWDFYTLETEGKLFLNPKNAWSNNNSHPSDKFAQKVYPYFCQRIIDVLNGNGDTNSITGM